VAAYALLEGASAATLAYEHQLDTQNVRMGHAL
jgi:hypothetical protein